MSAYKLCDIFLHLFSYLRSPNARANNLRSASVFISLACLLKINFKSSFHAQPIALTIFFTIRSENVFFFMIRGVAFEWNLMASCVWAAAKLILQKHFILDNLIVHSNLRLIAYKMKMVFKKNTNTFSNMLDPDDSRFSLNFTSIQFE